LVLVGVFDAVLLGVGDIFRIIYYYYAGAQASAQLV
jgi:hypothetical protein